MSAFPRMGAFVGIALGLCLEEFVLNVYEDESIHIQPSYILVMKGYCTFHHVYRITYLRFLREVSQKRSHYFDNKIDCLKLNIP